LSFFFEIFGGNFQEPTQAAEKGVQVFHFMERKKKIERRARRGKHPAFSIVKGASGSRNRYFLDGIGIREVGIISSMEDLEVKQPADHDQEKEADQRSGQNKF
jgi:hypothetical protein